MIARGIGREERKGRHHAARIAEANHPRRADAALGVAVQVHDVPAHDDGPGGEGAHGDEAQAGVLGREGVAHVHQDGEAGDEEPGAECDEGEAEARSVGQVGRDQAEGQGGGDGGDGVELGFDGGVSERFDDRRGEVGEGCR